MTTTTTLPWREWETCWTSTWRLRLPRRGPMRSCGPFLQHLLNSEILESLAVSDKKRIIICLAPSLLNIKQSSRPNFRHSFSSLQSVKTKSKSLRPDFTFVDWIENCFNFIFFITTQKLSKNLFLKSFRIYSRVVDVNMHNNISLFWWLSK